MFELVKVTKDEDDDQIVSARDLHEFLEVGRDFSNWIKGRIEKYEFEEGLDYAVQKIDSTESNGRPRIEYILKLNTAKELCRGQRGDKKAGEALKYFLSMDNTELFIIQPSRKEIAFGIMLEKITGLKWETQVPIDGGKYRLDFKLGNTLIIEYDEFYHEKQEDKDNERMEYCINWLAKNNEDNYRIPFIRVKEGMELEGLHEIILHLVGFEVISNWSSKGVISDIY